MTPFADLHIHTHYSDSTLSPQQVVAEAARRELACISITDHDTVDGIAPTREHAEKFNIETIAGIELSSDSDGKDIHLLGYFIDPHNQELKSVFLVMRLNDYAVNHGPNQHHLRQWQLLYPQNQVNL